MAPTKVLANKKIAEELELCKLKAGFQQQRIDELTKERDFLKEQLAAGKSEDALSKKYSCSLFCFVCMKGVCMRSAGRVGLANKGVGK